MAENKPITVLGIGNILLQDEGFGVHFVRWFAGRHILPAGVRVVDGGTLGYALLDLICGSRFLIVIDVIKAKDDPGSIYRFTREEMETHMPPPTSAHEVAFIDVLYKAELIDEVPETVFLCIVPAHFDEMGLELTGAMKERFPEMEKLLLTEFAKLNIKMN